MSNSTIVNKSKPLENGLVMEKDRRKSERFDKLRRQAEAILGQKNEGAQKGQRDEYHKLLHELEVHQIELEMQNEELRNAHEKLLESQERYVDLYDFAPIGYLGIDQNGQILEANLTGAWLLGVERYNLLRTPFSRFIAKESQDMFYLHCKQIFETTRKQTCELLMVKKDGRPFHAQLESIAIADSDGEYKQFRTALLDITERKKVEEELEKRTHDLIKRIKELNCLYAISNIVEKSWISLEEIIQRIVDIIPPSWQYSEIACARIFLEGQKWCTKNFQETIWKQTSDIMVYGQRIGALDVFYLEKKPESDEGPFLKEERSLIDAVAERLGRIIEYKKAEIAKELKIEQELQHHGRLQLMGKLAASIVHEIKNPLVSIGLMTQSMMERLKQNKVGDDIFQDMESVIHEVQRLEKLLENLTDFGKPKVFRTTREDIHYPINETLKLLSKEIRTSKITIEKSFNPDIPSVLIDVSKMQQVFLNVLLNAIDAMTEGGNIIIKTDFIREKIEDKITQNWVQIAIQDSGIGIKREDMPHLFEPFYSKSSERTGLGLSIVLGLIELHNGKIKIDSQEGKGTTVKIHLPVD
ncbi:MAG: ATP-binding protein [bacterium]